MRKVPFEILAARIGAECHGIELACHHIVRNGFGKPQGNIRLEAVDIVEAVRHAQFDINLGLGLKELRKDGRNNVVAHHPRQ